MRMVPSASRRFREACTRMSFRSHVILDLLPSYLTALLASIFSSEVNCHCWLLQIWHDFGMAAWRRGGSTEIPRHFVVTQPLLQNARVRISAKMREHNTLPSYIYLLDFAAVIKTKTHAFVHLAKTCMSRVPRIPSPAHISLDNERTRIREEGRKGRSVVRSCHLRR